MRIYNTINICSVRNENFLADFLVKNLPKISTCVSRFQIPLLGPVKHQKVSVVSRVYIVYFILIYCGWCMFVLPGYQRERKRTPQ